MTGAIQKTEAQREMIDDLAMLLDRASWWKALAEEGPAGQVSGREKRRYQQWVEAMSEKELKDVYEEEKARLNSEIMESVNRCRWAQQASGEKVRQLTSALNQHAAQNGSYQEFMKIKSQYTLAKMERKSWCRLLGIEDAPEEDSWRAWWENEQRNPKSWEKWAREELQALQCPDVEEQLKKRTLVNRNDTKQLFYVVKNSNIEERVKERALVTRNAYNDARQLFYATKKPGILLMPTFVAKDLAYGETLDVSDLSEQVIETLLTLYGTSVYPTLEKALKAALVLEEPFAI